MDAPLTTNVDEAPPGPTPEEIARRVARNNAEVIAGIKRHTGAPVRKLATAILTAVNQIDEINDLRDMIRNLCEEALAQSTLHSQSPRSGSITARKAFPSAT
jgi:hypothetical protein